MNFTQNDIDTLGDKLAGLTLNEGEANALTSLIDTADDEVAGFSKGLISFAPLGAKLGPGQNETFTATDDLARVQGKGFTATDDLAR